MSDYPTRPVSPEEARLWEEHTKLLLKLQDAEEDDYLYGNGWTAEAVHWAKWTWRRTRKSSPSSTSPMSKNKKQGCQKAETPLFLFFSYATNIYYYPARL